MKDGKWIPLDKYLVQFLPIDRPYTRLEAMFSVTVDRDNNANRTLNGYSKLWGWSRTKVRDFLEKIKTPKRHSRDTLKTLCKHPIRLIYKDIHKHKNTQETLKKHFKDTLLDTTTNNNTNNNTNTKEKKDNKSYLKAGDFNQYILNGEWIAETAKSTKLPPAVIEEYIIKIRDACVSKGFIGKYRYYDLKSTIMNWYRRENKESTELTPEQIEKAEREAKEFHEERYGKSKDKNI